MIQLTHIAEDIVAEMFNQSPAVQSLFAKQLDGLITLPGTSTAVANLQLKTHDYGFDGMHKIDIAILDGANRLCIPCEAKIGNDRLGKLDFERRFLKPCLIGRHRDERQRIAGNMIAILERKLPPECLTFPLTVSHGEEKYTVVSSWILIVRENTLGSWERNERPALSSNCITVSFEAIVDSFGGKAPFNLLIEDLLNFDYYEKWIV